MKTQRNKQSRLSPPLGIEFVITPPPRIILLYIKLHTVSNFKILATVIFAVIFAATAVAKDNLAILPFTGGADAEGETIAELFSYNKELNAVFAPIPRTSITRAIRNEQKFQTSTGMTDPDTIAAIGKQLGAQYVVAGSVTKLGDRNLLIISIIKIDDLRQIAGDVQTYAKIEEIQDKLPDMARSIVEATRIDAAGLDKLAVIPVELGGNVDYRAADALAQILSINLVKSGKYAVYPRTATLEQVQTEYENQGSGDVADENVVGIGKGENPRFVLSVAARSLGGRNMFNASIINLESGVQTAGGTVNYTSLNDGVDVMAVLARELTGASTLGGVPSNLSLVQSLEWLKDNAVYGKNYTITLRGDETVAPQTLAYNVKTVSVTLEGGSVERKVSLGEDGSLFTVGSGVTLTLGANVTLQGRDYNTRPLVWVDEGGTLILKDRARITGNTFPNLTGRWGGGGVFIDGGTFTMEGGEISGNAVFSGEGGGVGVDSGTFTMSGGTISGNTAQWSGGGVFVSGGTFTMSGGTISNNAAEGGGGGVFVKHGTFTMSGGEISGNYVSDYGDGGGVFVSGGTFTMEGGTISGNTASIGGGVYVGGTFEMSGGTINNNSADNCGGGVFVSGTFTMSGGAISGNTAPEGGGVYVGGTFRMSGGVYVGGTFTMSGGTISGDTAECGGGVFVSVAYVEDAYGEEAYVSGTFTMSGGTISNNTAEYGGGVYVSGADDGIYVNGAFNKTGGVLYGLDARGSLRNIATNEDASGHAVYVYAGDSTPANIRNSTAGEGVMLDSKKDGSAGGWE